MNAQPMEGRLDQLFENVILLTFTALHMMFIFHTMTT
jgi:hypothetical protein